MSQRLIKAAVATTTLAEKKRSLDLTGKRLTRTGADVYKLTWPFLLWSALILIVYGVSYSQLANVDETLVDIKLGQWSTFQSSRTLYFMNEITLLQARDIWRMLCLHRCCLQL